MKNKKKRFCALEAFCLCFADDIPRKRNKINKEQGTTVDSSYSSFNHSNLSVHSVS